MTHSIQEITAKIIALPEPIQQQAFNFIEFIHSKHESVLLSEQALAADWNRLEEDEAWITTGDDELKSAKKRRSPPTQFTGQVMELGDVMSSVSVADWGQIKSVD